MNERMREERAAKRAAEVPRAAAERALLNTHVRMLCQAHGVQFVVRTREDWLILQCGCKRQPPAPYPHNPYHNLPPGKLKEVRERAAERRRNEQGAE